MLILDNVNKKYFKSKVTALDAVSCKFSNSGLVYIVGPSGSGKSTLLKVIGGIEDYDGSIKFKGKEIKSLTEVDRCSYRRKNISLAFQSHELEKEFSTYENVDDILYLLYKDKKIRKAKVNEVLRSLDLFELRKKNVNKLSGGEKARVGLARALGKNADIYLLDEPLNGLNKALRIKVTEILKNLSKNHLVIVVTHQKDEISQGSTVLSIIDGKLKEVQKGNSSVNRKEKVEKESKNKFSLFHLIRRTLKKMLYNKFRAFCTSLTITVSLVSFGLASLISSGVVKEIESALTANIVDNAIALEKKDYDFIADERMNIDEISFEKLNLIMKDLIIDSGNFYKGDINTLFPNEHRLILKVDEKEITIPTLTVDKIFNIKTPYEMQTSLSIRNLDYYEIVLGLTEGQYNIIFSDTSNVEYMCNNNLITLNLRLNNKSWRYDADVLFVIKQVVITEELVLLHDNLKFLDYLVEEELELEISDNLESSDKYPWTLKRQSYVVIRKINILNFIKAFYNDSRFNDFDLVSCGEDYPYRFGIVQRVNERLDIGEIKNMQGIGSNIYSYSYSSSFYQFGDEGLYAGFDSPFYLSSDKVKINKLVDDYYKTKSPLLTSFNIKAEDNVIGGDLIGSMNNDSFVFETLNDEEEQFLNDKIIISSGLKEYLKLDLSLSNKVHYAYLYRTENIDGEYFHRFKTGHFEVDKIKEDKKCKIYQHAFFLTYFGLTSLNNDNAGNYFKALIRFEESGEELNEIKKSLQKQYPDYYFTVPSEKVKSSIEPTINLIKDLLYALSFFSFLIATFLLTYTLLLIVIEDKKSIRTKYILGYSKKDLVMEYGFITMLYSLIPGVSSALLVYFMQFAFSSSLTKIMSTTSIGMTHLPSILVLVLSIAIGLIANIFIAYNIYTSFDNKIILNIKDKIKRMKLINIFPVNR